MAGNEMRKKFVYTISQFKIFVFSFGKKGQIIFLHFISPALIGGRVQMKNLQCCQVADFSAKKLKRGLKKGAGFFYSESLIAEMRKNINHKKVCTTFALL